MTEHETSRELSDLPPSCRFLYQTLEWADEPLTISELANKTGYSRRTIQRAISKLEASGLIERQTPLDDIRVSEINLC